MAGRLASFDVAALHRVLAAGGDGSFSLLDLRHLARQAQRWSAALPRVRPFYAVKCNSDERIVRTLAGHGAGFDCASVSEIETVLRNAPLCDPKLDIIYANPMKHVKQLKAAADYGVNMTTCDSEDELRKIAATHPNAEVLLRLATDDAASVCRFSAKYGAEMDEVPDLVRTALSLGVNLRGVSFHVGSGCYDPDTYRGSVQRARRAFDIAAWQGHQMDILDIGGGFPGSDAPITSLGHNTIVTGEAEGGRLSTFEDIAGVLRPALDAMFPEDAERKLLILGEPGRYFAEQAASMATPIIGRRKGKRAAVEAAECGVPMPPPGGPFTDMGAPGWGMAYAPGGPGTAGPRAPAGVRAYTGVMASPDVAELVAEASNLPPEMLQVQVQAQLAVADDSAAGQTRLYVNESLYGAFNAVMFDHAVLAPLPLRSELLAKGAEALQSWLEGTPLLPPRVMGGPEAARGRAEEDRTGVPAGWRRTSVWGQTCDGLDCIVRDTDLPDGLDVGDWLVWPSMGAYTSAAASTFNGFRTSKIYVIEEDGSLTIDDDADPATDRASMAAEAAAAAGQR